ncbi:type II toxin-antitoxin system VapC family toxin [Candidatus Micrarchaeota archaeon]|nr:type II toxin-antitoxin system VapC family toxin [Candidatus Micrarchaeota archaeon]
MKLIDTSYFYDQLIAEDSSLQFDSCILDLTLYELGNVLLKHYKKLKTISYDDYAQFQNYLLDLNLNIIRVDQADFAGISKTAENLGLTFYDASYAYYAKKFNIELMTSDKSLLEAFKKL